MAFQNYSSFFALKEKGLNASAPKFLKYNDKFNLIFTYKMFNIKNDIIELNLGEFIGSNYLSITNNKKIIHLEKNLYVNPGSLI